MSYVIVKEVHGFRYYYGKFGRWEGLINHAVTYQRLETVIPTVNNLKIQMKEKENIYYLNN